MTAQPCNDARMVDAISTQRPECGRAEGGGLSMTHADLTQPKRRPPDGDLFAVGILPLALAQRGVDPNTLEKITFAGTYDHSDTIFRGQA
jgi:hypothetical protein